MKYLIVFEKTDNNFSAYVPDLPGCIATGDTKEKVEANIREAISFHIQGLLEDGIKVHPPQAFAEYEEVTIG